MSSAKEYSFTTADVLKIYRERREKGVKFGTFGNNRRYAPPVCAEEFQPKRYIPEKNDVELKNEVFLNEQLQGCSKFYDIKEAAYGYHPAGGTYMKKSYSVANVSEESAKDASNDEPVPDCQGIPWITAPIDGGRSTYHIWEETLLEHAVEKEAELGKNASDTYQSGSAQETTASQRKENKKHEQDKVDLNTPSENTNEHLDSLTFFSEDKFYVVRGLNGLHDEIIDFTRWVIPREAEIHVRNMVIDELRRLILFMHPKVQVNVFGSCSTGLYLPMGDIDVAVIGEWPHGTQPLYDLRNYLIHNNFALETCTKVLDRATVPIIKLVEQRTHLKIDISFNVCAGEQTAALIACYMSAFSALRPLVLVVKQFLQERKLNEVFSGGLSSYGLILLVVHFLMACESYDRTDPVPHLGQLLYLFFEYYGELLEWRKVVIRVKDCGKVRSREEMLPDELRTDYIPGSGSLDTRRITSLAIEDPLQPGNDVGRSTFRTAQVFAEFAKAARIIRECLDNPVDLSLFYASDPVMNSFLGRIIRVDNKVVAYRRKIVNMSAVAWSIIWRNAVENVKASSKIDLVYGNESGEAKRFGFMCDGNNRDVSHVDTQKKSDSGYDNCEVGAEKSSVGKEEGKFAKEAARERSDTNEWWKMDEHNNAPTANETKDGTESDSESVVIYEEVYEDEISDCDVIYEVVYGEDNFSPVDDAVKKKLDDPNSDEDEYVEIYEETEEPATARSSKDETFEVLCETTTDRSRNSNEKPVEIVEKPDNQSEGDKSTGSRCDEQIRQKNPIREDNYSGEEYIENAVNRCNREGYGARRWCGDVYRRNAHEAFRREGYREMHRQQHYRLIAPNPRDFPLAGPGGRYPGPPYIPRGYPRPPYHGLPFPPRLFFRPNYTLGLRMRDRRGPAKHPNGHHVDVTAGRLRQYLDSHHHHL